MIIVSFIPKEVLIDAKNVHHLSKPTVKHVGVLASIILKKSTQNGRETYQEFIPMTADYIEKCTSKHFYRKLCKMLRVDSTLEAPDQKDALFEVVHEYTKSTKDKQGVPKRYALAKKYLTSKNWVSFEFEIPKKFFLNEDFPEIIDHFHRTCDQLTLDDRVFQHYPRLFEYNLISSTDELTGIERFKVARTIQEYNDLAKNQWIKRSFSSLSLLAEGSNTTLTSSRNLSWWHKEYNNKLDGDTVLIEEEDHLVLADKDEYLKLKADRSHGIIKAKLHALQAGKFYGIISRSNGRLSSNFTQLNSPLISYVKLENQHLVSFDLKTSQPSILLNLLLCNSKLLDSLAKSRYRKLRNLTPKLKLLQSDEPCIHQMLNFVIDEDIYSLISEKEGIHRSEAKVVVLKWLFGKGVTRFDHMRPIDDRFPSFRKLLVKAKTLFNTATNENGLAILLQNAEAHLFVELILAELAHRNIPAITKHDSILVANTPERRSQVLKIIEEAFHTTGFKGRIGEPEALFLWEESDPRITYHGEEMYYAAPDIYHEIEDFKETSIRGEKPPWQQ